MRLDSRKLVPFRVFRLCDRFGKRVNGAKNSKILNILLFLFKLRRMRELKWDHATSHHTA